VKEAVGKITGNRTLNAKGKIENVVGKVQEKVGRIERHADERAAARKAAEYDARVDSEL
jgi:uncharacterized protein YjbJ (UPF0337 family)